MSRNNKFYIGLMINKVKLFNFLMSLNNFSSHPTLLFVAVIASMQYVSYNKDNILITSFWQILALSQNLRQVSLQPQGERLCSLV